MKRLKSTLAAILMVAAGAAAIGLGTVMAVAALVIGLVIAVAARLAIGSGATVPASADTVDGEAAAMMCHDVLHNGEA